MMAKAMHENVQNAVGVELNAGLHRSAQSWVSKIKQIDFVLGSYLQSATFIEADMFDQHIPEYVKLADVIFCNNLLFDEMQSTRRMQATSINGRLVQMIENNMVRTGACIVTTTPIGRVGSRAHDKERVPINPDQTDQRIRMGVAQLIQCHKFEFPDRSFQWTSHSLETSKPHGYISTMR